ncbi:MAG TPA: hypothetical protein PKE49_14500 [Leptospiraceae bacterium]|nr:hypothetical protein [Leptospirales bacterium]HMU82099.1 hypothetical protein [Leptospiraceae bacterium]HMX57732.1 hypothetical protein [Leptospiraceae bacterium]HNE21543.1 hypothetical protein [Leptospiraceae bacterium]HNJ34190.1 hypothetical protein [Leptospiraceae bacterium]
MILRMSLNICLTGIGTSQIWPRVPQSGTKRRIHDLQKIHARRWKRGFDLLWLHISLEAQNPTEEDKRNNVTQPAPATPAPAPDAIPDGAVDVQLKFTSNFLDRGEDRGRNRSVQRGKAYNSKEDPWFFQPSAKIKVPGSGLYFNAAGSFALSNRNDKDVDQKLEDGPTGEQTLLTDSVNPLVNTARLPASTYIVDQLTMLPTWPTTPIHSLSVYKMYKDANGLKRGDQIDLSFGHQSETKLGNFDFGINASTRTDPKGKSNPFGDGGANYQKTEMYVTYAPPFLTELSFTILADVVNSDQYMKLAYTKEFEIKENLKADVSAGLGYMSLGTSGQSDSFHGLADSPFGAGISWNGFRFGLEATYRHSYDIYDSQVDGDPRTSRALYIDGGSTAGDGLVTDPSRTKGFGNQLVNSLITSRVRAMTNNTSYTYTPRQKVPRWLYAVNVSYSTSL